MTARRTTTVPRTLRWTSAGLVVVSAAVVTGAVAAWLQGPDDGVVPAAARPRPSSAAAAPRPAAARPVAAPPVGRTRIDMGAAGVVVVSVSGGSLVVHGVRPAPGWTVERARAGRELDVRVRNGRAETRVEASVVGGEVVPRVRTKS